MLFFNFVIFVLCLAPYVSVCNGETFGPCSWWELSDRLLLVYMITVAGTSTRPRTFKQVSLLSFFLKHACSTMHFNTIPLYFLLYQIICRTASNYCLCFLLINWFCMYRKRLSIEKKNLRKNLKKNLGMKLKSVMFTHFNYFFIASWGANFLNPFFDHDSRSERELKVLLRLKTQTRWSQRTWKLKMLMWVSWSFDALLLFYEICKMTYLISALCTSYRWGKQLNSQGEKGS